MKISIKYISKFEKFKQYYRINRIKLISYIVLFIAILILFYIAISPINRINGIRHLVKADSLFIQNYDSTFNSLQMKSLLKERTYKLALLKLAEQDSIQLVINLCDSFVYLTINGVIIHSIKIDYYRNDLLLRRLPSMEYAKLFSEPLLINAQYSTIVKEPIVVKEAPKDTIEAAINAYEPDTLIQKPAFLQLKADYGIDILFKQDLNPTLRDKIYAAVFYVKIFTEKLYHIISFSRSLYHSCITIKIKNSELRAIYRALPCRAYVVLIYNS